jgi:prephenate dehydrogenase
VCAIDGELTDKNIGECDVIIVALYPKATLDYITKNAMKFKKGAKVIDCCGVKQSICEPCFNVAKENGFEYYGGHPMAGTQFSGFNHAKETLFKNASMIIVPENTDDICALEKVKQLFTSIGFSSVTITDAKTHDEMISYTSQLAHVVSNAYVKSPCSKLHKGFSAGSFKDLTRVATLNEEMWTELFMENGDHLTREIDRLADELKKYSDAIKNKDSIVLKALLKEGCVMKAQSDKSIEK